jgi:hypothetical protein
MLASSAAKTATAILNPASRTGANMKNEKQAYCPPIAVPGRAERQQGLRLRGAGFFMT